MVAVSLPVAGMTGASNALRLEGVLSHIDGVVGASVNFASERAIITYVDGSVSLARLADAVRQAGYAVPLESTTLAVPDLVYASSARTVRRVLGGVAGVVSVDAQLASGQIRVDAPAGQVDREALEEALAGLGLHALDGVRPMERLAAMARSTVAAAAAIVLIASALVGAWWLAGGAALVIAAAAWPIYRRALAALSQGEYDAQDVCALITLALLAGSGLLFVLSALASAGTVWPVTAGLVLAGLLTIAWPGTRALALRFGRAAMNRDGVDVERRVLWAALAGMAGLAGMLGLYLGILSVANSPAHAFDQLGQDLGWVVLVALGFGVQVGMHTLLRLGAHAATSAGNAALSGAGTMGSTIGMIACCAHHVADLAPLAALLGASGMSGFAAALNEWKFPVIAVGLLINAIGVYFTWRVLRRSFVLVGAMA